MRNLGADILALFGDLFKMMAQLVGRMLAVIFCGGLIGVAGGAVFSVSQQEPFVQSIIFGGFAGAILALLAIIAYTFLQSW